MCLLSCDPKSRTVPNSLSIVMPQAIYQVHLEFVVKQIIYNPSTALSLVVSFTSSLVLKFNENVPILPNKEGERERERASERAGRIWSMFYLLSPLMRKVKPATQVIDWQPSMFSMAFSKGSIFFTPLLILLVLNI